MKRFLLTSVLVLTLAGGAGYGYRAAAEPGGGPPGAPPGPWADGWGRGQGPDFHGGPDGGPPFGPDGWRHHGETFSLFGDVPDKKLDATDVKVIADAILLEHGNHDWTVTNIAGQPDKSIDFSYATPHGDIIATFVLDPVTGRIKRLR